MVPASFWLFQLVSAFPPLLDWRYAFSFESWTVNRVLAPRWIVNQVLSSRWIVNREPGASFTDLTMTLCMNSNSISKIFALRPSHILSAVVRLSRLHTAGGRNASWNLPLGVARTVCFESANQMVHNEALIIITCVSHFPEFPFLLHCECARSRLNMTHGPWPRITTNRRMSLKAEANLKRQWEKKWKWQVKRPKNDQFYGDMSGLPKIYPTFRKSYQNSRFISIPRAFCWLLIVSANQKATL